MNSYCPRQTTQPTYLEAAASAADPSSLLARTMLGWMAGWIQMDLSAFETILKDFYRFYIGWIYMYLGRSRWIYIDLCGIGKDSVVCGVRVGRAVGLD